MRKETKKKAIVIDQNQNGEEKVMNLMNLRRIAVLFPVIFVVFCVTSFSGCSCGHYIGVGQFDGGAGDGGLARDAGGQIDDRFDADHANEQNPEFLESKPEILGPPEYEPVQCPQKKLFLDVQSGGATVIIGRDKKVVALSYGAGAKILQKQNGSYQELDFIPDNKGLALSYLSSEWILGTVRGPARAEKGSMCHLQGYRLADKKHFSFEKSSDTCPWQVNLGSEEIFKTIGRHKDSALMIIDPFGNSNKFKSIFIRHWSLQSQQLVNEYSVSPGWVSELPKINRMLYIKKGSDKLQGFELTSGKILYSVPVLFDRRRSDNGRLFATISYGIALSDSPKVIIYSSIDGSKVLEFPPPSQEQQYVALEMVNFNFSPDGTKISVVLSSMTVGDLPPDRQLLLIFDLKTKQLVQRVEIRDVLGENLHKPFVNFSPGNSHLDIQASKRELTWVVDRSNWKIVYRVDHKSALAHVQWSDDNSFWAVAGEKTQTSIWSHLRNRKISKYWIKERKICTIQENEIEKQPNWQSIDIMPDGDAFLSFIYFTPLKYLPGTPKTRIYLLPYR